MSRYRMLAAGLFWTTLATLILEVLDTRLLSVITWYHLSFLAVSVAMLGLAAGAVLVFAGGDAFSAERARRTLPRAAGVLAVVLPVAHLANLVIPFPASGGASLMDVAAIGIATLVLALPFIVSGVVITLALTRAGGPIGLLYAADLAGAAGGCLAVIWLLEHSDITATALAAAGCAAAGAWCFARHAGQRATGSVVLAAALFGLAVLNPRLDQGFGVLYPKNPELWGVRDHIDFEAWNAHSHVIIQKPFTGPPFLWGAGRQRSELRVLQAWALIDGEAGTPLTAWDGDPDSLHWVQHDVTALPYHVRRGRVGIIGVGGGRDVLTALWARSNRITGIEINGTLVDALQGPYRELTGIADDPSVTLVHDEARSYLARTNERFDVLQMSLIDTWAATGAGAFTLSENGLYTREAWQVFLDSLTPDGVLSVSRWFEPGAISETTRLVSLGTAALLDAGVSRPRDHLVLATRGPVATLMLSRAPFTRADAGRIGAVGRAEQFDVVLSPWGEPGDARLARIAGSLSQDDLAAASAHPYLDFTAPTDSRPFFFNMLKPRGAFAAGADLGRGGVLAGNMRATTTLLVLAVVAGLLVTAIIGWPLAMMGRPSLPPGVFGWSLLYFAIIGAGFMLIQIAFLQRFSVYLGHPTYAFSIILFLMIGATGLGSLISDRVQAGRLRVIQLIPVAIALGVALVALVVPPLLSATVHWALPGRTAVVCLLVAPLSMGLGFAFPIGVRLVGAHSDQVVAWMWGVNGACGVMASIVAVGVSMWMGITANLVAAAMLYGLLAWPMARLVRPALLCTNGPQSHGDTEMLKVQIS